MYYNCLLNYELFGSSDIATKLLYYIHFYWGSSSIWKELNFRLKIDYSYSTSISIMKFNNLPSSGYWFLFDWILVFKEEGCDTWFDIFFGPFFIIKEGEGLL